MRTRQRTRRCSPDGHEPDPNLDGAWVSSSGMLHFNFCTASPSARLRNIRSPLRRPSCSPGLPYRTLIGAHYATNSVLSPRYPNEWEFFGRVAVLLQNSGAPLDVAAQVGYNLAAQGPDGEASLARQQGPVRILAALRVLADPGDSGGTDVAVGEIQPGGRRSITFSKPGTYPYHCTPHPFMKGVVEVR
jgi:hypothetical protein